MKISKHLFTYCFRVFIVVIIIIVNLFSNVIISAGIIENVEDTENSETAGTAEKYIALTFDDGPHPIYTIKVLDILSEKNIPATFFVVGFRAELHPALLKKMRELKCEIGNHTYNHTDLSKVNQSSAVSQIEKCGGIIHSITGEYPKIYRPPYGVISKANQAVIPLEKIMWTVDSCDWKTGSAEKIVKNVTAAVKDRSIILMHDFYEQTVDALPEIIDILLNEGYKFVTVSELYQLQLLQ